MTKFLAAIGAAILTAIGLGFLYVGVTVFLILLEFYQGAHP